MNIKCLGCVCSFLALIIAPAQLEAQEFKEPPQTFKLIIDGKQHEIELDKDLTLPVGGNKTTIKLVAEPNRRFKYGGLEFPYPSSFGFEVGGEDTSIWTLDGNGVVIMVVRFHDVPIGHEAFARSMAEQYGSNTAKVSKIKSDFGGKTLDGSRVAVELAGGKIQQDIFEIPIGNGSRLIMLQDSLSDDGKHSKEFVAVEKLLSNDFKFTPK